MLSSLLFLSFIAFAGAALSVSYELFPSLAFASTFGSNALLGAAAGGIVAAGLLYVWRRLLGGLERDDAAHRLLNSLTLGLAGIVLGFVWVYALGLAFPSSPGSRIGQGVGLALCTVAGLRIGFRMERSIFNFSSSARAGRAPRNGAPKKILDTSIIIDGRIGNLLATGFVEGEILVPEFVLAELQNIADSSNSLRRRKGRRGLDVLNQLMQDDGVSIRVTNRDYPTIREVDRKLIHLAKDESAVLITTDYNLNRVAQVEGVSILNVNELSNAVKPRYIPGEGISVEIIDRGEEINQGIGYLDDGTMVVVENGRRHIGRTIKAVVKSTLQTDAGRMLFVEPAGEHARWER